MSCEAVANVKTKKTPAVVVIRRRRQPVSQEPVGRSASANMPLTAHSRLLSKNVQIRLIIFNICNVLPPPLAAAVLFSVLFILHLVSLLFFSLWRL